MNKANVSYTRNNLSKILARVREGESILIVDREQPVARLEPVGDVDVPGSIAKGDLVRRGLVLPARVRLDPKALSKMPLPATTGKGDVLDALLADREEGR